jgi:hypothetical protein
VATSAPFSKEIHTFPSPKFSKMDDVHSKRRGKSNLPMHIPGELSSHNPTVRSVFKEMGVVKSLLQ